MSNNIDIEAIADGIVNNNEVGSMFFSIMANYYDEETFDLLSQGLRCFSDKDELISIFKSTNADNLADMVIKSCDAILVNIDKILTRVHNIIVNSLNKERDDQNDYQR